jgi:hypothetical protein
VTSKPTPRVGRPLAAAFAGAWTMTLFAEPLRAQPSAPPSLALTWSAPADCPSRAYVLDETQRLLGGPATPHGVESVTVRAVVKHDGGWSVSIETRSGLTARRRTLRAKTCRGLADATGLIVALMIDSGAVDVSQTQTSAANEAIDDAVPPSSPPSAPSSTVPSSSLPQSPPVPSSAAPPAASIPSAPAPVPPAPAPRAHAPSPPTRSPAESPAAEQETPRTTRAPTVSVGMPFSIESGSLPELEYGVGGSLAVRIDSVRLELSLTDWLRPAVATASNPGGSGASFELLSGALVGCYAWRWPALDAGPCLEIEAGRIHAKGFRVSRPAEADALWLAAGGGILAAIRVTERWSLPLHLDLLVSLDRNDFLFQNVAASIYRTSPLAERLSAGVEYLF